MHGRIKVLVWNRFRRKGGAFPRAIISSMRTTNKGLDRLEMKLVDGVEFKRVKFVLNSDFMFTNNFFEREN